MKDMTRLQGYMIAKEKKFCPYCMHDLWYEDWCHECDTKVPLTFSAFVEGLKTWGQR